MGQIGFDTSTNLVADSYELVDASSGRKGYYSAFNAIGYVTVNEAGHVSWEPLHNPWVPHQEFTLSGNIATFWPTGEKNVSFKVQVRP